MGIVVNYNSNSNETFEDNVKLLLERIELKLESNIETKVMYASFNANNELKDDEYSMTLDKSSRRKKKMTNPTRTCVPQELIARRNLASINCLILISY